MAMRELLAAMRQESNQARPVSLRPAGRRRVKFCGPRGADGPLTTGQSNTLNWVSDPAAYTRMIEWVLDLPDGATLDDIAAAFSVLVARHESLRTTFPAGGPPVQRVAQSGELTIDVYEVDAEQGDDGAAVATALIAGLRSAEFDLAADLPVRVAVAISQGRPRAVAVVYSHMVADLGSMAVLGSEFTQLARGPASQDLGPPGHQPLDQAVAERSPRGRRMAEAALRSWETQLRSMSQCTYAVPREDPGGGDAVLSGWLWSAAAAHALPHIAARTRASPQAAVLAALCAVLSLRTGQARCSLTGLLHNRFGSRLRSYVGSLASDAIITVDTDARGFDDLVRRAGMTTLRAGKGGLVDGNELQRVVDEVEHDRGIAYARDCVYNDASYVDFAPPSAPGDPADARQALGRSELRWIESAGAGVLLAIFLRQVEEEMVLGAVTSDPRRVPRDDIESLLRGVELLLVAAAPGDFGLDRVGEITGVKPVMRGPGWLLIDSCWVELAEVQRIVDDAVPTSAPRVFAEPGPAGELQLVAYLAASEGLRSPGQAHDACMAVLPGGRQPPDRMRYTAMAPGRYVICAGAPANPADLAAWHRQPVLACGDGRSRQARGAVGEP
jgi:Condensation domain